MLCQKGYLSKYLFIEETEVSSSVSVNKIHKQINQNQRANKWQWQHVRLMKQRKLE